MKNSMILASSGFRVGAGRVRCPHRAASRLPDSNRRGGDTTPCLLSARCFSLLVLLGLWTLDFGLWTSSAAQSGNSATNRGDYSDFQIIGKRNIFNPNRSRAYVPRDRTPTVYRRIESFALVGVMSYGKGPMAFFDGTRSDYKKVLKPNDTIGGFKVTAIDDSSVKLASSTNEIEVQVGMQMASEDGGPWKLSVRPESLDTGFARDTPMLSAEQVNSERAAAASNQNGNNPFANFFANGGFRGGFNPGGFNGSAPVQNTQTQPAPASTQPTQSAPTDPNDVLARLAARRAQETGEPQPNQQGEPPSNPAQAQPGPTGQSPPSQQTNPNPGDQPDSVQLPANQQNPADQRGPAQLRPIQRPNQSPGTLPSNQRLGALPGQNLEQSPNQSGEPPRNPNP
jgi:hypothetical protein